MNEFIHSHDFSYSYADTFVRSQAVGRLKELSHDELYDLLPQLVQVMPSYL